MRRYLVVLALVCGSALGNQAEHDASHAIASGAIFGLTYAGMRGIGADRTVSTVFGVVTSGLIGVTYKLMEDTPDNKLPPNFGRAMLWNGIGIVGVGAILIPLD